MEKDPVKNNVPDADSLKPLFSVITPTFNRAKLLPRAVQSVLNQTFTNLELIVIDDGSTDNTPAEMARINDHRLRYIRRQGNKGRCAARNAGVTLAKGEYVTFLDSDDEAMLDWLENLWQAFQAPQVGVVCAGVKTLKENGQKETIRLPQEMGPVYENQTGLFLSGSFALRRELFEAVGGYVEQVAFAENTELALRLIPYCVQTGWSIVGIPKPLVRYYKQPIPDSARFRNHLEGARYILDHHGQRYREKSPWGYANRCSVAGVSAARLGNYGEARRFFMSAIRVYPWQWQYYARFLLTLMPALGRKVWLNSQQGD